MTPAWFELAVRMDARCSTRPQSTIGPGLLLN